MQNISSFSKTVCPFAFQFKKKSQILPDFAQFMFCFCFFQTDAKKRSIAPSAVSKSLVGEWVFCTKIKPAASTVGIFPRVYLAMLPKCLSQYVYFSDHFDSYKILFAADATDSLKDERRNAVLESRNELLIQLNSADNHTNVYSHETFTPLQIHNAGELH